MSRFIKNLISLVLLGVLIYAFRQPLQNAFYRLKSEYAPCTFPLAYSIGHIDPGFELSEDRVLKSIADAEKIWEDAIGKNLFTYKTDGNLKISLVYDYRQQATTTLKALGIEVENSKASYDSLKIKYEALKSVYNKAEADYLARTAQFDKRKDAYEAEVASWNAQGGAPKKEYERLAREKAELNAEVADLAELQSKVNKYVDDVNAMATVLNRLVSSLNLKVAKYNEVGGTQGEEFQEGVYQSDSTGQKIEIYEFSDRDQLVRVLAHEMGHALGLEHVSDPEAIMYKLNQGESNIPTKADLDALKTLCKIK